MPTINVNSGPHKALLFVGHDSADAYDKQAGKVGACVESADTSDIYRSLLPEAHKKFAEVLSKAGIARGVNAKGTEAAKLKAKDPSKVEDVPETYTTYANRVKETLLAQGDAGKAQWAELDKEIHDIAAAMECDSSPSARERGPGKDIMAKADEVLARSEDAMEASVTKLLAGVEGFDLVRDSDGKPERDSLGLLIQAYYKAAI